MPIAQPIVSYEWIKMPDSSGFGTYTEPGIVIPCLFGEEEVSFVSQMYLDIEPPISAGREIWGFPKKYAHPKLEVVKDTLTGTLEYAGQQVAMGTMGYNARPDAVLQTLVALEAVLRRFGAAVPAGAGADAASDALAVG